MIFSSRPRFPKPVHAYKILNFFGNNIVTTEFDEWKRYRKISAPAFNEVRDPDQPDIILFAERWLAEKQ